VRYNEGMNNLRFSLHQVALPFWVILAILPWVLFCAIIFDVHHTNKTLQALEVRQVEIAENTHNLLEWVDEDPRQAWEIEYDAELAQVKKNIDGDEILSAPPKVDMVRLKAQGCVADGFLSGYGGDINSSIALINRSECYYLHRALETWLRPPDIKLAREIKAEVTKPNTVYSMFIAEAIDIKSDYYYPQENRQFDFDKMCRKGSENAWGEHSCKPSLEREEYRKYVKYITQQAMDMGVQVFLFGQVFYQDNPDADETEMPRVIAGMREHAKSRGMEIVVGAQTNDIEDERYLRLFDFIEGGVGLRSDGSIEENKCFSRWYQKPGDWCWALLWHESFRTKANNVLVHFDWSGKIGDDMSVFTRMEKEERVATLKSLQKYFVKQEVGFMMPMLATLHQDNGGCHGKKKRFYSASKKYSCNDEESVNAILKLVY
jgi:hypothetical protein